MWTRRSRPSRLSFLLALTLIMFAQSLATLEAGPIASRVSEFTLANGLRVVVVPDHRAPVVTHYVWYLAGSADDPPGPRASPTSLNT
jgi:zinc protease